MNIFFAVQIIPLVTHSFKRKSQCLAALFFKQKSRPKINQDGFL